MSDDQTDQHWNLKNRNMGQARDPVAIGQSHLGIVWHPWAMGGGEWKAEQPAGRISDEDVERIARAVVRLLREP